MRDVCIACCSACSVCRTVVTTGFARPNLLRFSRRVQCGWGLTVMFSKIHEKWFVFRFSPPVAREEERLQAGAHGAVSDQVFGGAAHGQGAAAEDDRDEPGCRGRRLAQQQQAPQPPAHSVPVRV